MILQAVMTHTHTHTQSLSLSYTHTHTHCLSLSLTHTHTHTHTHPEVCKMTVWCGIIYKHTKYKTWKTYRNFTIEKILYTALRNSSKHKKFIDKQNDSVFNGHLDAIVSCAFSILRITHMGGGVQTSSVKYSTELTVLLHCYSTAQRTEFNCSAWTWGVSLGWLQ